MYVIVYGTKTFELDSCKASDLLTQAEALRKSGDLDGAQALKMKAVEAENL